MHDALARLHALLVAVERHEVAAQVYAARELLLERAARQSSLPATSAATSFGSSMRILTPAASRAKRLLHERGDATAVGAAVDGSRRLTHHPAHVLARRGAGVGDHLGDDRTQVVIGQLSAGR